MKNSGPEKNSAEIAREKLAQFRKLFPEAVTEGKADLEALRRTLGEAAASGEERYGLNWAGKTEAFRALQTSTTATLAPCQEESINFVSTGNVFIEGENLEVLKVLQKAYYGKIKMIYIDPPYNTGNDSFIYPDRFQESKEEYLKRIEEKDEAGYLLKEGLFRKNSRENGHYHSNWLSMMYPRLFLARNLLREDGVIFVSIDDNEVHNLRLLMNEIFGEENFLANICHKSRASVSNDKIISSNHNHILVYFKNLGLVFERRDEFGLAPNLENFDKLDERGKYKLVPVDGPGGASKGNPYYTFLGVTGYFRFSEERMATMHKQGLIVKSGNSLQQKYYLEDAEKTRRTDTTWWDDKYYNSTATARLKELMGGDYFDNPKPVELISRMMELWLREDGDIVLDFFAGSGTTAQAMLEQNARDGGSRQFVCVQMDEVVEEGTDAFSAGFKTIAEITKERIRRCVAEISQKHIGSKSDLGFKVFKLKNSNFKIWRGDVVEGAAELERQMELLGDPVKAGAKEQNLLWELLLKSGYDLNTDIEEKKSGALRFYLASGGTIALVLGKADEKLIHGIINLKPRKVVCLDNSFENNDQLKTNASLQFKDAEIAFTTV